MAIKRDNWTNDEVLSFLKDMEKINPSSANGTAYTDAIDDVRDIFEAFQAPTDIACGPMAYDTESKVIVYVGPVLPR
tara:strand:+ start:1469 stop:1699 length:231 start_codon:yes stop_codon:yes gene_type:complete